MTKFRTLLLAALCALGASQTNAAEQWHVEYVKWVYPLPNGDFVVSFVNSLSTCLNTASSKYFHVRNGYNGVTAEGVKAMLATALMAFASGKRLQVAFDDTSTNCDVNRMLVLD